MLKQLTCLIRKAGNEIKNIYQNKTVLNILYKDDESPVTDADNISQKIIIEGLKKLTPDIPILSEENALNKQDYISWNKYWLIDPLDGTKEFISNNDEFSINIAFIDNGIPVIGLIYVPMYSTLYYSWKGLAWKEKNGIKRTITVKNKQPPVIVVSHFHNSIELDQYLLDFKYSKIIKLGSSLKFCLLAEGKIQMYPRFGRTSIWDIAAGHAIVSAAGGFLSSTNKEEKINYILSSNSSFLNPGFVAFVK